MPWKPRKSYNLKVAATNYKALVRSGYDQCAVAYHESRRSEAGIELDALYSSLEDGAAVLDVGCGAGVPVARALAKRFRVTGVDISESMISLARANVPAGRFVRADVMSAEFTPSTFDAATAFYSIFHVPREEHPTLFRRIHDWLKPGGYLLCLLPHYDEEAYIDDFFGSTMYWSSYALEDYLQMLNHTGFDILEESFVGSGFDEAVVAEPENHPIVFARKRKGRQ